MEELAVQLGRRIVANLPPGVPLLAAIDALCTRYDITEADIRLRGAVRRVRLSLGDDTDPIELSETVQVVTAEGHLAPDLGATGFSAVLAWSDRGLPRVVAGFLEQAESAGVRVIVESWAESEAATVPGQRPVRAPAPRPEAPSRASPSQSSRAADVQASVHAHTPVGTRPAPTVRPPAEAAARAAQGPGPASRNSAPATATPASPSQSAEGGGGWAAAVAASRPPSTGRANAPTVTANGAGPFDEDPEAKLGDILVHPQWGRCKVLSHPNGDKVKIRLPTGRFVDLNMSVLNLVRQADEDGARVFRVSSKRG